MTIASPMNVLPPTSSSIFSPHPQAEPAPDAGTGASPVGGRLVDTEGRELPLVGTHLEVAAVGGIARTVLEQTFRNVHDEPLLVTYKLPLPATGAVSGFRFRIDGREIVGEVDRREAARERFAVAIAAGHTAALLEQTRANLFEQAVGNIPPGAEVRCEVEVDQRLDWLSEGAWEWRFPTVVGPRYMGAPGVVPDAASLQTDYSEADTGVRGTLSLRIGDALPAGAAPHSPSHRLTVDAVGSEREVRLASADGAALDRDIAVRWSVAAPEVGASLRSARPASTRHDERRSFGLLTVVPPLPSAAMKPVPRDLIFLIDTSGSMGGVPLDQAKRVICAMIDSLGAEDRLELISFGSRPCRWKKSAVVATRDGKAAASKWVRGLEASGGTEMQTALYEALSPLRGDAQRQVVLVTDGYIGFENQIVETVLERLPERSRLHTLGVGAAPNRALTGPAARAGRGLETVIGPDEDVEPAAKRLLERTVAPLVTELTIDALGETGQVTTAPDGLPDLFAGCPALIGLELPAEGGRFAITGETAEGTWRQEIEIPALTMGEGNQAIATLYGRERIEDLEMYRSCASDSARRRDFDASIERIGLQFQIASRLTSWVAVDEEARMSAGTPYRQEEMPHPVPYGTSVAGLGLRPAGPVAFGAAKTMAVSGSELFAGAPMPHFPDTFGAAFGGAEGAPPKPEAGLSKKRSRARAEAPAAPQPPRQPRLESPEVRAQQTGELFAADEVAPEPIPVEAPSSLPSAQYPELRRLSEMLEAPKASEPVTEPEEKTSEKWPWIVLVLAAIAFLLWLLF